MAKPVQYVIGQPVQQDIGAVMANWRTEFTNFDQLNIKERVRLAEAILGFEMKNRYDAFDGSGRPVLFLQEESDCCTRNCLAPECRPWKLQVSPVVGGVVAQPIIELDKDCTCTYCCLNRPEIAVQETGGNILGRLNVPCECCDETVIASKGGQQLFKLHFGEGGCCQGGLWCPCPCEPCNTVKFVVEDPKNGQPMAKVDKKVPGCLKMFFTDADNYHIDFGHVNDPEDRALLVAAAMTLDVTYFSPAGNKAGDG